ncbi:glucosidase [bacterium]|nr:glucosidase [bacterium]
MNAEIQRLREDSARSSNWKRWGPYLSERQWGTVREDYSQTGECWDYFPHDHARSRAYRWGEDGLLGWTDRECRLCFGVALWNGRDPILKERLFGLTNPQGNHGEDVKESYYYLDSTPTHSYAKALYKYPHAEFPYLRLLEENRQRGYSHPEFELSDTGIFNDNRYFDVQMEYAKATDNDTLIRLTITNRGPDAATIHVLPQFWFRNTWSWGCEHEGCWAKPRIWNDGGPGLLTEHETLGRFRLFASAASDGAAGPWLFTENETNYPRLYQSVAPGRYFKDGFHDYVIQQQATAVNTKAVGTKVAAHYVLTIEPGCEVRIPLRIASDDALPDRPFDASFYKTFDQRIAEADEFYKNEFPAGVTDDHNRIVRQAHAGLLWSKQFYHYIVKEWLQGDPGQPAPPAGRLQRNAEWQHLFNRDIISMPDKWEYPWYAAWDLAFHMIPFARLDGEFAKEQLLLLLREWYMHPSGQMPAYEFAFSDANPPVHAWACWRVYKIAGKKTGRDRLFLKRVFQKLLLNFTWWVNRKDARQKHLFSGGFLGLDNIGLFDRNERLPDGTILEQADGTAWMAFYCVTMLAISLELAQDDPAYEDVASKFFEHFVAIADAMNTLDGQGLWDELDGFYYDHLHCNGSSMPLRVRSMVGIIPLFAVYVLDEHKLERLPGFKKRFDWFLQNRQDLAAQITLCDHCPIDGKKYSERRLLAIPSRERLERMLKYILSEEEFLSKYGIRSLSKVHQRHPVSFRMKEEDYRVDYWPGESQSGVFGGNSNWRGPIWFPVNFLLIEALEVYHHFYGESFTMECPTGSGQQLTLLEIARLIEHRLSSIFLADDKQRRPCHGTERRYAEDEHWKDLVLFYEYFHGETGRGLGASHQTGWTALAASIVADICRQWDE